MVNRTYFFQLTQANAEQIMLHTIASETGKYPKERDTINTAGMKMKATTSKAIAVGWLLSAELEESNMATSWVVGSPKKRARSPDLVQTIRKRAEVPVLNQYLLSFVVCQVYFVSQ